MFKLILVIWSNQQACSTSTKAWVWVQVKFHLVWVQAQGSECEYKYLIMHKYQYSISKMTWVPMQIIKGESKYRQLCYNITANMYALQVWQPHKHLQQVGSSQQQHNYPPTVMLMRSAMNRRKYPWFNHPHTLKSKKPAVMS